MRAILLLLALFVGRPAGLGLVGLERESSGAALLPSRTAKVDAAREGIVNEKRLDDSTEGIALFQKTISTHQSEQFPLLPPMHVTPIVPRSRAVRATGNSKACSGIGKERGFAGKWSTGIISNDCTKFISSTDGGEHPVEVAEGRIALHYDGATYTGTLDGDRIRWNDNDVWERVDQADDLAAGLRVASGPNDQIGELFMGLGAVLNSLRQAVLLHPSSDDSKAIFEQGQPAAQPAAQAREKAAAAQKSKLTPATKGKVYAIIICAVAPVLIYIYVMKQVIQMSKLCNDGSDADKWSACSPKDKAMTKQLGKLEPSAFPAPVESETHAKAIALNEQSEHSPGSLKEQESAKATDDTSMIARPRRESSFRSFGQLLNRWVCTTPKRGRS